MRTEAECRSKATECYDQSMPTPIGEVRDAYMRFAAGWWQLSALASHQDNITQQSDVLILNVPLPESH